MILVRRWGMRIATPACALIRNDTLMMLDNKKESGFSFEKSDSFTSLSFSAFRTEKTIDRQEESRAADHAHIS